MLPSGFHSPKQSPTQPEQKFHPCKSCRTGTGTVIEPQQTNVPFYPLWDNCVIHHMPHLQNIL
ncbi:hypothetical protein E2320_000223 [Naja naja]|nr:hypothetical protein E2320_000223 [Naja naja]